MKKFRMSPEEEKIALEFINSHKTARQIAEENGLTTKHVYYIASRFAKIHKADTNESN